MADSLDALLDEVEAKFCREISVSRAPSCTVKAEQDNHRQRSKDFVHRNNMPDCNKLQVKLKRRRGARAYACQCSWHSAVILSELGHIPNLKWVCGKHTAC
ncbi:protein C8orf37-like [Silurus asotus]|uniref:Cilia- and flagella-associated protein 418 n=1 Tax=Silurus asotus TaxID=30991 RepID=A0AAD4ZYN2_SILAS|nr:protein C8orf37-like [Silurus asotus]